MKSEGRLNIVSYQNGIGGVEIKTISASNDPARFTEMLNDALADYWRIVQDINVIEVDDVAVFTAILSRPRTE